MTKLLHGNEKSRLTSGREPLFSQKELLVLAIPLLVEQLLEVTVGMADTMMVSRCGEAAISGVSLVDMINNRIIVLFAALATGGAVVVSQYLGAKERGNADKSAGQLLLLSGLSGVVIGAVCFVLARPMIRLFYGSIDTDVLDAGIFSVQETKMQPGQADFAPEGYTEYTYSAEKKGYSGTACWCKTAPLAVTTGIGLEQHDHEGRVLTLEYPGFYLVNCYTPNSQDGLKRLDYRMEWEDAFRAYLLALDATQPVILCGDLNVAHTEMDIKNAKTNRMSAGFTDQERAKMTELLAAGFADSFRVVHPDEVKYSWWSYRFHAREKNAGWRIDYFIVSRRIADRIRAAEIHNEIFGSDHCPVELQIDL